MKLKRLKILLTLSGIVIAPQISQANQILKCTDREGIVSYHNNKNSIKYLFLPI